MLNRQTKVPNIRILPMSKKMFSNKSIEDVQREFFTIDLSSRNNREYKYTDSGMRSEKGDLVLFQYDNAIIAFAILDNVIKFTQEIEGYKGEYHFKEGNIAILSPINKHEIKSVWNMFKMLSQSKQRLDTEKYPLFWDLIQTKSIKYAGDYWGDLLSEEVYQCEIEKIDVDAVGSEEVDCPKKKPRKISCNTKTGWVRNPTVAKGAIIDARYSCEIDSKHKHFRSQVTGENYVEAHHLIPMENQDEFDNSLDIRANVVSLCPACHKKLHYSVYDEKVSDLEKLYRKRSVRLDDGGINITIEKLKGFYKK